MSVYQTLWFFLVGVLLTVFAILDGFDLGVGFWHLWTNKDEDRRLLFRSVGPFWDGNEVWLLTGGGALFAAFPPVYATVFSGFYMAMMLVIIALILRAVSGEFRSAEESATWRKIWDVCFSLGSILAALLFGVALGNILRGIPMDADGNYTGTFLTLLNPYALLIGVLGLAMLAFHGAIFITMKASNDLEPRAHGWATRSGIVYIVLYIAAVAATIAGQKHLLENYNRLPILWLIPIVALCFIIGAVFYLKRGRKGMAFASSSFSIAGMMSLAGAGLFPRLVPALQKPDLSLTAWNSSSSELTLRTMLILALIGVPVVAAYTIWVYRIFRGKMDISLEDEHY